MDGVKAMSLEYVWAISMGPLLQSKAAQRSMIIWSAAERPVKFALTVCDRLIVDACNAQAHEPVLVKLPVFVAIAAKPIAAIVVPFIGEADSDAVIAERPQLLDQAIV